LQGRTPIHEGGAHTLGERGGEQGHTLTISEIPTHTHVAQGTSIAGDVVVPTGNMLADSPANLYAVATSLTSINAATVTNVGGSQAHLNMQPFLVLNFSIALQGIFPSQ